jgi:phosphoglycerate-specific signal transduction histidine kinase
MDTATTTTDLVVTDAEVLEDEANGFGKELASTALVSTATAAVVIGGFVAFNYLKPRVVSLFHRSKEAVEELKAEATEPKPEPEKKN